MFAFHNFHAFFHMGGYAPYVWSAFSIGSVFLFGSIVLARFRFRRVQALLRKRWAE